MNSSMFVIAVVVAFFVGGFTLANIYAAGIIKDCDTFGKMRVGEAVYECKRK